MLGAILPLSHAAPRELDPREPRLERSTCPHCRDERRESELIHRIDDAADRVSRPTSRAADPPRHFIVRTRDWLLKNSHHAKMAEVSVEGTGAVREGERVAPEEPLDGDDRQTEHRNEEQAEGVLPPDQTRVEEAESGCRSGSAFRP
jgi:hypothetical protein